jgi:hypothetical protein
LPFASGSISFARFAVVGEGPSSADDALLEKLAANQVDDEGLAEEEAVGWCGGRHLLDDTFSFETNVYADCVHVGMRVDTNKPPGDLRKAYAEIELQASTPVGGFVSKAAKKDAREAADRRLDEEARSGRFRRSKMTPILWDVEESVLYGPSSASQQTKLYELFDRTFGLTLIPLTAGELALRKLEKIGHRRDYEDARPTAFATSARGTGDAAEYPWVAKGGGTKDFFGNEFLTWLWWSAEHDGGGIEAGDDVVTVMIDKAVDLDCVFGLTGRGTLRGDGPGRMPEAKKMLAVGKCPRKLGLLLDAGSPFGLTLAGETLATSGLVLPDPEDADSPRVLFEERIGLLRDYVRVIDTLYESFLRMRAGDTWPPTVRKIRDWVKKAG